MGNSEETQTHGGESEGGKDDYAFDLDFLPELENFRFHEKVGEGGMGVVFRATDILLGRTVAIKKIRFDDATKATVGRFIREAQIAASLPLNPRLVSVHNLVDKNGQLFLVMEWLDGQNSEDYRRSKENGEVPWKQVLKICIEVCDALSVIHEKEVVHRDIKPSNIMLQVSPDGDIVSVKLMDFGLAKTLNRQALNPGMFTTFSEITSSSGSVTGTPAFLSPEQLQGNEADCRSDIYALTATLYMLICGEPPLWGGSVAEIVDKHCRAKRPNPCLKIPSLPQKFQGLIEKGMAIDPKQRFQNASEMRDVLQKLLEPKRKFSFGNKIAVILLSVILLVIGIWFVFWSKNSEFGNEKNTSQEQKFLAQLVEDNPGFDVRTVKIKGDSGEVQELELVVPHGQFNFNCLALLVDLEKLVIHGPGSGSVDLGVLITSQQVVEVWADEIPDDPVVTMYKIEQ